MSLYKTPYYGAVASIVPFAEDDSTLCGRRYYPLQKTIVPFAKNDSTFWVKR